MSQSGGWIPHLRPNIAFSPHGKAAESGRGGVGVARVALWRAFPQTQKLVFPNLLDICPVFLLVFSPLETADILILF